MAIMTRKSNHQDWQDARHRFRSNKTIMGSEGSKEIGLMNPDVCVQWASSGYVPVDMVEVDLDIIQD